MEARRRKRGERASRAQVELSDRDEILLRALARFRLARTSDLAAFAFAGIRKDTAAKRLRCLFNGGYLEVLSQRRTDENVYALGPEGKRWLEAAGGRVHARPSGGLEHHLGVVRAWVALAVSAHGIKGLRLESLRPDWEVRAQARANGSAVVPDALVELLVGAECQPTRIRLALEVDLGTEPGSVLRDKLRRYRDLLGSGGGLFGWRDFGLAIVLVGDGTRRRPAIERLLDRHWPGWWVLWTNEEGPRAGLELLFEAVGPPLTGSPSVGGGGAVQPSQ
jgi:hypothetical protein